MELDLVDGRHNGGFGQQSVEVLGHEVADPDGADFAVGEEFLQRPVGRQGAVEGRGQCLVEDEQVQLVDAELAGGLVERVQGFVVAVVADPDLRLDEHVVACDSCAADAFADLTLVGVGGRGVDVPVTEVEGLVDDGGGDIRWGLEDAEAEGRHGHTVVQGDGVLGHGFTVGRFRDLWQSLVLSPRGGGRWCLGAPADTPRRVVLRVTVQGMDLDPDVQRFLTELRARLSPEQAGVTVFGGERRVRGLRREKVAQLAGVSTAYYTRMERGNLRGVSESVLRSVAFTLQMNGAETEHLFNLARVASEGPRTARIKPQSRLPRRASQLIDAMPDVPTVALGRLGDMVGANALGRGLFPHLFPENGAPLNHTRYLFLDNRSRDFYVDWEGSARHVVSVLRLIAGRDPSDPALMAMVGELATHSPEFRQWWAGHTVNVHTAGTKAIRHPVVGELTLGFETLTLASAPDVRIVTYLADPGSPSADALDLLRSWVATTNMPAPQEHSQPR